MHPRPRSASLGLALALSTAGFVVLPGLTAASHAAAPTAPYISEINYDNDGSDADEFVEVHLPASTTSAGLSIVLYNGNGGGTYATYPLPDKTAPDDAPAVATVDTPGIQNGAPDGLALVRADGTVVEFLSYEGTLTATGGPAQGQTSTDIGLSEGTEPVGQSLQRTYDAGTDQLVWSGPRAQSKDQVNVAPAAPPPGTSCETEPTHDIGEVQGEGDATPLPGDTAVTVRGVVVGDLPSFSGYYLQDVDGDGNAATSDGIFVFDDLDVDLGDTVAVTGKPSERFGQTQLNGNGSGSSTEVCADGTEADLPAAATLDLPAPDAEREKVEGMLVAPADVLTVSEVYDLTSYGELTLSEGGLLVQPTELARPGSAEAAAIIEQNELRRILLDDGLDGRLSNIAAAPYLSPTTPVRVGDKLTFTEPLVLGYGFSQWRLQPADGTADGVFKPRNTRPAAPEDVHGDVQVGAFNVLNYFLTFDQSVGRGARNAEQLDKQAAKIVPAIQELRAEVVTLMEIEDTDSTGHTPGNADVALADLVRRLNEDAGFDKWAYVPLPERLYSVRRDVIRNGIIYQPRWVETVGEPMGIVDETIWFNAREPLAQTFMAEGDKFTVVANHFKSKSPGSSTGDNADSGDGQGEWNGDRVRQAKSLIAFTKRLVRESGDRDLLLMGDFNAYTMEDPIEVLRDAGFVDLGEELDPGAYSYVFNDMSGSLDHALASRPLFRKVTGVTHWNINAVESFAYQYYGDATLYDNDPYRSSDHDPLLLGLELEAPTTCFGQEATLVGTDGDDVLKGTKRRDVIVAGAGQDRILGFRGADLICAGDGGDVVRAGRGADQVYGQGGHDDLYGGGGDDALYGGRGNDALFGQRGTDTLRGGAGENTIEQGKR